MQLCLRQAPTPKFGVGQAQAIAAFRNFKDINI